MANVTLPKLPGTLKRCASRIADYENDTRDDNGHWVHLADGWKNSDDPAGINHTIHETTLAECADLVRKAIPCDCVACVTGVPNPASGNRPLIARRNRRMNAVLRCVASGENAYSYAPKAKPEASEPGYASCPECGRRVKLRKESQADRWPRIIPTHNRVR